MTDTTIIQLAIIGCVIFAGVIGWLVYEAISAPIIRPWDDFRERTPAPEAEPGRELSIEDLERLHGGNL